MLMSFFRILHLEEKKLGDDDVGDLIVDWSADEDDPVFKKAGIDIVGPLHPSFGFDDSRNDVTARAGRRNTSRRKIF